jgi:serine/threonine-protein kinase
LQEDRGAGRSAAPDWTVAFAKAGLDTARFTAVVPRWTPPFYADTRAAWDGAHPERPDIPLHVEAAAAYGRAVYFELLGPWRQPARADADAPRTSTWFSGVAVPLIFLGLMAAAALLTARNLQLGRCDRRGAFRIAGFAAIALGTASAIGGDLHASANGIFGVVLQALAEALPVGALAWVGYIALEPYVRRRWPRTLIAWSRLVGGRWRDPLVGRDILAGVAVAGLLQLPTTVMQAVGALDLTPSYPIWILDGLRFTASWMSTQAASIVLIGIGMLFGFLLVALVVRRAWIAGVLVVVFFATAGFVQGVNSPATAMAAAISVGMLVVCLLRFGLLLTVVTMWTGNLISGAPLTLDPTVWYSPNAYLVMAAMVALAGFGAWTSANLGVAVSRRWRE